MTNVKNVKDDILIWLPSPMGDAVLATPALRAIRNHFKSAHITFFANPVVRQVLSPTPFANAWLEQSRQNSFSVAGKLKQLKFTHAILFKNSFGSALACFLAGIPFRIGYAREGRGLLLTDKIYPQKLPTGRFKPVSALDYCLAVASYLGAETKDRSVELSTDPNTAEKLKIALPQIFNRKGPLVILVPGAAAGPSKCWPAERFVQTADWLISDYGATVVLSVAPNPAEKQIAADIVSFARHNLINLADHPVDLATLKSLFSLADLVIANDTGPRHIAIAFKRKIITLVGPNNPAWTDPGYADEVFVKGNAPCAPCDKPVCRESAHFCMEAITVEMVCKASASVLDAGGFGKRGVI
jgi:heptosyltransferase-2